VVRSGAARIRVPLERVQALLSPPGSVAPAPTVRPVRLDPVPPLRLDPVPPLRLDPVPPAATLDPECDLRGLRVDEALDLAEHHLHRMWSAGLGEVRFIHGHGTGALRDAIRAWLPQVSAVSRFAPAERERGGNGVTVVTLER